MLAIGGYLFTRAENSATQASAEQRAKDEALQAYLDQMGQLMLDRDQPLRKSEEDSQVRTLARARTLTVLPRLDGDHKARVVQFLYESDLIAEDRVVDLDGADLSRARLNAIHLLSANLSKANLREATLIGADLSDADLSETNLSGADMNTTYDAIETRLRDHSNPIIANLAGANLTSVNCNCSALWVRE